MESFKTRDCKFLLLVKIPNGEVHQVITEQDAIISMLNDSGSFQVLDKRLDIDFTTDTNIDDL